jgi:hypothetical protein
VVISIDLGNSKFREIQGTQHRFSWAVQPIMKNEKDPSKMEA